MDSLASSVLAPCTLASSAFITSLISSTPLVVCPAHLASRPRYSACVGGFRLCSAPRAHSRPPIAYAPTCSVRPCSMLHGRGRCDRLARSWMRSTQLLLAPLSLTELCVPSHRLHKITTISRVCITRPYLLSIAHTSLPTLACTESIVRSTVASSDGTVTLSTTHARFKGCKRETDCRDIANVLAIQP